MEGRAPKLNDRLVFRDDVSVGDKVYLRRVQEGVLFVFRLEPWRNPESCEYPVLEVVPGTSPNTIVLRPIQREGIMNSHALELWSGFRSALFECFAEVDSSEIISAWARSKSRTRLYSKLISKVSKRLDLDVWQEFLAVDWALRDRLTGEFRLFVESENDFWKVSEEREELPKLCACRCEVGVLITCAPWSGNPDVGQPSKRAEYLPMWVRCVQEHSGDSRTKPLIVALVGEMGASELRFYEEVLVPDRGKTVRSDDINKVYGRRLSANGDS
jgi:hypothetical protein